MAKLNWVIICERAVVDSASNSLSVMNVLEQVHAMRPTPDQVKAAAGRPIAAPLTCAVVTYWERSNPNRTERNSQVRLRLIDPKGKTLVESSLSLDLGKECRSRLIANLTLLPVDLAGRYVWRVYLRSKNRWQPVGEVSYELAFYASAKDVERLQKAARKSAATLAEVHVDKRKPRTRAQGRRAIKKK